MEETNKNMFEEELDTQAVEEQNEASEVIPVDPVSAQEKVEGETPTEEESPSSGNSALVKKYIYLTERRKRISFGHSIAALATAGATLLLGLVIWILFVVDAAGIDQIMVFTLQSFLTLISSAYGVSALCRIKQHPKYKMILAFSVVALGVCTLMTISSVMWFVFAFKPIIGD